MRQQIKHKVYSGYMDINSCLQQAQDLVYWPGMSSEIYQFVET